MFQKKELYWCNKGGSLLIEPFGVSFCKVVGVHRVVPYPRKVKLSGVFVGYMS